MFTILFPKPTSVRTRALGRPASCRSAASRGERRTRTLCSGFRGAERTPPAFRRTLCREAGLSFRWLRRERRLVLPVLLPGRFSRTLSRNSARISAGPIRAVPLRRMRAEATFLRLRPVARAAALVAILGTPSAWADPRIDRSVEANAKELITPQTQQAIDAGLAFLATRQDLRDGSLGSLASSRRRVAVTALFRMAVFFSGIPPGRGKCGAN